MAGISHALKILLFLEPRSTGRVLYGAPVHVTVLQLKSWTEEPDLTSLLPGGLWSITEWLCYKRWAWGPHLLPSLQGLPPPQSTCRQKSQQNLSVLMAVSRRHPVGIYATSRKVEGKTGKVRSITEFSPGSIRDPSKMSKVSFDHPLPYSEFVISTPNHILTAYTLPNLPSQIWISCGKCNILRLQTLFFFMPHSIVGEFPQGSTEMLPWSIYLYNLFVNSIYHSVLRNLAASFIGFLPNPFCFHTWSWNFQGLFHSHSEPPFPVYLK